MIRLLAVLAAGLMGVSASAANQGASALKTQESRPANASASS